MRFLHTADIHLKRGADERLEIFSWLVKRAGELKVDCFIVAGDLFDSDHDATQLRQEVRRICESSGYRFLFLPGNHDAKSFGPEYEYGDNVTQLTEKAFGILRMGELNLCGVPYGDSRFSDRTQGMPSNVDLLVAHGTLYDPSFIFSMLDEDETGYMPIFPADLEDIARYVALGHLHSRCIELQYKGTRAVYPGSPVAIDTKCVGARYFFVVDIDGKNMKIEKHLVEIAPYWLEKEFFVYPGIEKQVLDSIGVFLRDIQDARVMPNIKVRGYISEKEKEYLDLLSGIEKGSRSRFPEIRINAEIQSWDKLLTNPLVQRFAAATGGLDDELRMKVFEITFPIFSKALK